MVNILLDATAFPRLLLILIKIYIPKVLDLMTILYGHLRKSHTLYSRKLLKIVNGK